jgi:hypothetical protein
MTGVRYARTAAIKESVVGHELDVLGAIGIDWRGGRGRTDLIEEGGDGSRHRKSDTPSLLSAPVENRDDTSLRKYLACQLEIEVAAMLIPCTCAVGSNAATASNEGIEA